MYELFRFPCGLHPLLCALHVEGHVPRERASELCASSGVCFFALYEFCIEEVLGPRGVIRRVRMSQVDRRKCVEAAPHVPSMSRRFDRCLASFVSAGQA